MRKLLVPNVERHKEQTKDPPPLTCTSLNTVNQQDRIQELHKRYICSVIIKHLPKFDVGKCEWMYLNRAQLVIPYSSWITSDFWFMKIMTFYFLKSLSELDSNKPHSESVIGSFIKYFCLNDRKKSLFRESIKLPPFVKNKSNLWDLVCSSFNC